MRGRQLAAAGAAAEVRIFNARYPVGTEVRFWTGVKEGPGKAGFTRSEAFVCDSQRAVVLIRGCSGYVALSHVEPVVGETIVSDGWFPQQVDGRRQTADGGLEA